jgi:alpha-L-fucosidase
MCGAKRTMKLFQVTGLLLLLTGAAFAQGGGDRNPSLRTPQESLRRWRALRVGAFVHWSPQVLYGLDDPKSFRGERFDAKEWVQLFQQAGFKYIVFTTKHGDAVCMWDSRETERTVMNTPMKRDVVGELAAACRRSRVELLIRIWFLARRAYSALRGYRMLII